MRDHRAVALLEVLQPDAAVVVLRRKAVAQDTVEPLPGGERLRTFERADQLPRGIENLPRGHVDAEIGGAEPQAAQRLRHHRLGDNAGAAPGELAVDALVDVDGKTVAAQHQAGKQAAHRAADHQGAP